MNWLKTAKMSNEEFEDLQQVKDDCIRRNGVLPGRGQRLLVYTGEDVYDGHKYKYVIYLHFDGREYSTSRYQQFSGEKRQF
jgi:hypothetical protein